MERIEAEQTQQSFSDRFAVLAFVCVIACLSVVSWGRYLLHPDVRFFPLLWDSDKYNDLLNYAGKMLHLERGAGFIGSGYPVFNYLAPAAFVYHFLLCAPNPVAWFQAIVLGFFVALLLFSAFLLRRAGRLQWEYALGLLALLGSFPIAFVVYRANLEGIVWVVVTASLCLFLRRWYVAAAVVLAFAMSIKPFPCFLLLLFMARRQYRAAALSVGLAIALVIWGLAALGPGIVGAYRGLQPGVLLYTHDYLRTFRSPNEQGYAHGVLDILKVLDLKYLWLRHHTAPEALNEHLTPAFFPAVYAIVALGIATAMIWRLRGMPTLNQVLGAEIALTLLPPSAADYTLCALYLPVLLIGLFLVTEVRSRHVRLRWGHLLLLVLPAAALLAPLTMLGFWASTARLVLLLLLTAGACSLPMSSPALDGPALDTAAFDGRAAKRHNRS